MKKNLFVSLISFFCLIFSTTQASAQMFFSSSFDQGVKEKTEETKLNREAYENDPELSGIPHPIRDRIRADALRVLFKPDEVYCYGISRKNPQTKSDTISGYALTGSCGSLNEEGISAIKEKIFSVNNFDMTVSKISAACIIKPKLLLRYRRGIDFVDIVLSGDKCPGFVYLYAGDTKEFYAKPMSEWMETFITAVSNDIEPINDENLNESKQLFIRKKPQQQTKPVAETSNSASPQQPVVWGRRFN